MPTPSTLTGESPLLVQFFDTSINAPTSWLWDFGNGETSTLQNPPVVTYQPGEYTVSLTVTNAGGTDTKILVGYVISTAPVQINPYWSSINYFPVPPYDGGGFLNSVSHDSVGNVIAVGSQDWDFNYINVYKWNRAGTLLWNTQIGTLAAYNDIFGEMVLIDSSDNIYVLGTLASSWPNSVSIHKLNADGTLVWQKSYSYDTTGGILFDSAITSTGLILSFRHAQMMKIDFNGNIVWTEGFESAESATVAAYNSDLYFYVPNSGLCKYNSTGVSQWTKSINGPALSWFGNIATHQSGILFSSESSIIRLDSNGNIVAATEITGLSDTIASICIKSDKLYFVTWTGQVGVYDLATDTVLHCYQFYLPGYIMPDTWYFNTFTGCLSASPNTDELAFAGYGNNAGVIFNIPINFGEYPGMQTLENGCTIGPIVFSTTNRIEEYYTQDITISSAPLTSTVTGLSYAVSQVTYQQSWGPLISYIPPLAPVPNFTSDITAGPAPLTVAFTDTSENSPTSWFWNFGDSSPDGTTNIQNPTHTYTAPGSYTVSLYVENEVGFNQSAKVNYITVPNMYQSVWDASINSPVLSDSTGTQGHIYIVNVPGTANLGSGNVTYAIGDLLIHNGTTWDKVLAGTQNTNLKYMGVFGTSNYPNDNDSFMAGSFYIAANSGTVTPGNAISVDIGDYLYRSKDGIWQKVPAYETGYGQPVSLTTIPLNYFAFDVYGNVNGAISWGDNSYDVLDFRYSPSSYRGVFPKSYGTTGVKNIKMVGEWSFLYCHPTEVTSISTFGNTGLQFIQMKNNSSLTSIPSILPRSVTSLWETFWQSPSANNLTGLLSWDTSNVTDFTGTFANATNFNQNIGVWNTSGATRMRYMFDNCPAFNQNISSWNTSNVTDMSFMFRGARNFNQNISSWNTGNVTNMEQMFADTYTFNQPLNSWDVSKVTNFSLMFRGAGIGTTAFNQPLDLWNTSSATTLYGMFTGATTFNQPLNSWNTNSVTNMYGMFQGALAFNQALNLWNTSNVSSMEYMFSSATSFNQDISSWVVTQIPTKPFGFSDSCPINNTPFEPQWGI